MDRKLFAILLACLVAVSLVGPAAAKKGKKSAKPVVVFEDPAGDSGVTNNNLAVPGTDQAGLDLTGGTIQAKGKDVVFTVTHSAMPDPGSGPESFRLLWHINVDGTEFRFTVKSVDVGKPDPVAQTGTDRVGQVDTDGHFRLEQCAEEALPAVLTLVNCNPVEEGYLEGAFDPASATVTWNVPLSLLGAKKGSVIAGGVTGAASTNCQICWVPHYAERSLTPSTIVDSATQTVAYTIPKK
jgi:hypothetical protein